MKRWKAVVSIAMLVAFLAACGAEKSSSAGRARQGRDRDRSDSQSAQPQAQASQADKALFEQTCSKCHPTAKPEKYEGPLAWKDIVAEMINEKKAEITPENAAKIVAYLDAAHPKK